MICLAIDTSGAYASVAILEGSHVRFTLSLDAGRTHSEILMPLIDRAFSETGLGPRDIGLFAAVAGPGSFTGVRIGVLTIKALAHAAGKPCAGVSSLETLAEGAQLFDGVVAPMLDARRDQVYAAAFASGAETARLLPDEAQSVHEFFDKLPGKGNLCFTGDGALKHAEAIRARFGARGRIAPGHAAYPRAADAGALAMKDPDAWTDYARLAPIYLRAPQAERERAVRDARR